MKNKIYGLMISILLTLPFSGCTSAKEVLLEYSSAEETEDAMESDSGAESSAEVETAAEETGSGESQEASSQGETDEDLIYVYICGEVVSPGVYAMQPGDRICDLVEAAGGLTEAADPSAVNQAEVLSDEQMVYIYSVEEEAQNASEVTSDTASGSSSSEDEKVNINTAGLTELTTLPGIGEAKAQSIIDYREENGDFSSIEDIMNVNGIKEGIYAQIKDDICV